MLRRIVGAKYTKEPNNFLLQFKYLDSDFNNINLTNRTDDRSKTCTYLFQVSTDVHLRHF